MKNIYRLFLSIVMVLAIVFEPLVPMTQPVLAQGTGCASSSPSSGSYTVTLCFYDPVDGSTLVGDTAVAVTISVSGTSPGVQRVIFYLDGAYLLTDYQSPYTFTLPTAKWVDGNHTLAVESLMRDGFTAQQAYVSENFNNNVTTPPVNTNQFQPSIGLQPANGAPFIVAASGDGASGEIYAGLVADLITSLNPNLFLYLGDVYEKGSVAEFYNWYGTPTINFGRLKSFTNPTIGNHEYENGVAPGYFDYWDNVPNYYSYNAGGWHFISLNSNTAFEPADPQSAQYQWLQQDLAAHAGACTIAYYHHPLFNIGAEAPKTSMSDAWALMNQYGVSIVLNGHDHDYQRWMPLDANGQPSSSGITEFVAGGAGHGVQTFTTTDSRVAYSNDMNPAAFGVLLLQLNSNGANFSYVNTGGNVLDSGVIPCVNAGPDSTPPTVPGNFTADATSATNVDLSWSASSDDTGVSGYTVYRDGTEIAMVSSSTLSYTDKTALPETTYAYSVEAFDPSDNYSGATGPISVTTPSMSPSLTFQVEADTYVNSSSPATKYGSGTVLRADASPDLHSYLRFTVQGLAGYPVDQAILRLYANNSTSLGISADAVADNSWDEFNMTYGNAPALGGELAASGAYTAGDWVELDVTSYITGEGTYSFGITTPGSSTLSFPSRESGANAAELTINFLNSGLDTEPPSVPTGLAANASGPGQVDLSWNASIDNVGVTGYTIYRDGTALDTVPDTSLSYSDTTASPNTTYQYTVDAFDADNNHSAQSDPVSVTTPGAPATLTLTPVIDAYVNAGSPTKNYGHSQSLRADGSPDVQSYIRFDVQGTGGAPISRARLFIYAKSSSTSGLDVEAVNDNTWDEYTVTYANGPALGSVLASSPPVSGGTWIVFDVTSYVTGEGLINFGVSTAGPTAIGLSSRESGANSPQLIVDFETGGPDTQAPDVPTGLTANAVSTNQVDLSWDASTDNLAVAGYTIYRDGTELATVSDTSLTYSDTTVVSATTYQYSVDAFDAAGNHSAASAPVSVSTPDTPPTVPTGLAANVVSSTQVDLGWNASTDNVAVVGYTIYRDGTAITTVPDTSLSYSDTTVLPGVTYSYAVDAFDGGGNHSATSTPVTVTTPDTEAPSVPTSLAANASGATQVDLSWVASTDNVAVTGYTIYRDGTVLDTVPDTSLSYSDTNASPNTTYQYSVDAFDGAGNHSATSAPASVTTPDVPSSLTFVPVMDAYVNAGSPSTNYGSSSALRADGSPDVHSYIRFDVQGTGGAPISRARLFIYANSSSTSGLDIEGVSDNTWDEYTVTYDNAPALGSVLASSPPVTGGTWIAFDVTSYVTAEGSINFGVSTAGATAISLASRESGANSPQLIVDFQTSGPDTQAPDVPTGLTANAAGATQVDLSWSASTDNVGVTGYTVYRDGTSIATVSGSTLSYSDTTVSSATTYQYGVDAFDAAGNHSAASAPVSATTPDNPPTVPTGLTANAVSSTQVDLSWIASTDNVAVAGYTVYRDGAVLTIVPDTSLSYSDTTVLPGITYSYAVDAFDNAGNHSATSTPVTVTTPDTEAPSIPTGLTANASSATQVDLSWVASTDNVAVIGYTIYRDGSSLGTVSGSTLSYSDTTASAATTYQYSVDAFDGARNHSTATAPVSVTTPDVPSSLTLTPDADAYVDSSNPSVNYGSSSALRVDGSPVINSYLRFTVSGLSDSPISQAQLLIHANSSSTSGLTALTVADNTWDESTITYTSAPALGSSLGTSPPVTGGTWITFDVTSYVNSEGTFSFGLSTPGATAIGLESRESGVTSPQLIINVQAGSGPDTEAPSTPTGLNTNASSATQVDLNWGASTDNVAVTGYTIYRDGSPITAVSGSTLSYSDTTVSPATTYQYSVDAFDGAGNTSAATAPVSVTTPDVPSSLTLTPDADAYVSSSGSSTNHGSSIHLRVDGSPPVNSYLRFTVSGLGGSSISQAQLLIYANSSSTSGLTALTVADNTWDENTITYANAPAMGGVLGSSPAVSGGTWIAFDVASYVNSEGTFSFGLSTPGATAISLSSRESGSTSPQLVLTLQ
jgi:chitodextrinase